MEDLIFEIDEGVLGLEEALGHAAEVVHTKKQFLRFYDLYREKFPSGLAHDYTRSQDIKFLKDIVNSYKHIAEPKIP